MMKLLFVGKEGKMQRCITDPAFYETFEICQVPFDASGEEILAAGRDADFILADAISVISGDVIRQMPNLKMIHSEGVAYNGIDVKAASEAGVLVCNCQAMNATAVAEQAILLMLGLLKNVVQGDRDVREGRQIETKLGYMVRADLREIADCRIGLIGFGAIAKATARIAAAMGAEVVYYSRHQASPETEAEYHVRYLPLAELLGSCDIVSLHLPVTPETVHMVNGDFLRKMKEGSYLINTARGDLVCAADLLEALRSGRLAGAGLDTLEDEPVGRDHEMLKAAPEVETKILYSPHIGGITASSFRRGYEMVRSDLMKMAAGDKPDHIVNGR